MTIRQNMKTIHTTIVQNHLNRRQDSAILNRPHPAIDKSEQILPHTTVNGTITATNKHYYKIQIYLYEIDLDNNPSRYDPFATMTTTT